MVPEEGVHILGVEAQGLVEAKASPVHHHNEGPVADAGGSFGRTGLDESPTSSG